jgi:hypothetical protein
MGHVTIFSHTFFCNVLQALSLLDGLRSTGLHSRVELCLQDQLVRSGVGR